MDLDKIRKQIDALLNTNGCTAEEAQSRQAMAERILKRFGMSVEDLKEEASGFFDGVFIANRVETVMMKRASNAIGRLTRTKPWMRDRISPKSGKPTSGMQFHFTGYTPDAEWANWLAESLCNQLKVELASIKDWRAKEDFASAFGKRVSERMIKLAESMEDQLVITTTEYAIVADDMKPIEEYLSTALGIQLRSTRLHHAGSIQWMPTALAKKLETVPALAGL